MTSAKIPKAAAGERVEAKRGERPLYVEGDAVDIELLLYPGPREFKTVGEVVECLSPTYYVVAFVNHKGMLEHKRFMRSQLP
jgi:hypothetical protein